VSGVIEHKEKAMKKYLLCFMLLLFTAGVVSGCSNKDASSPYTEPSQVIKTGVGQEFIINLSSNPTTGFDWECTSVYEWIQLLGKTYQADNTGLIGSGGTDSFTFKAHGNGTATLVFTYKRSWETTSAGQKTFTVEVN
jgi:inhibitor of cysteine peptidase